ncbi:MULTISPECIES: hypothetical protein [unclassified Arthrobacter]|uniref:hypothetical protein n=1 Tax=unclassified Arthrobacter TaxID=235627 RepID=UPI0011B0031B|nr:MULTISPECIES: hypothetical protein [unclassified Arthrobacter]
MSSKAWYLAPTVLNGVVSIASVPLLILFMGSQGWAEIALGQAIGLFGSVLVGLGWPVVGPALMANCTPDEQYRQYVLSLWARVGVALIFSGAVVSVFIFIPSESTLLLWTAIASSLLGCASSWYFLGIDDPRGLFWQDAFARALGTSLGIVAVGFTGVGELFALGLFLGLVLSMVLTLTKVRSRRTSSLPAIRAGEVIRSIRVQGKGLGANILFVALSSVALPLMALIGGPIFVAFAVLDKVQKQLTTVALPLTQLITGKMAGDLGRGGEPVVTAQRTFRSIIVSGAALACFMIPLGPLAVEMMSAGTTDVTLSQMFALALVVGLAFVAQCLPIAVLAPINSLNLSLVGMSAALIVGIPILLFAGQELGMTAVLLCLCFMYSLSILFGGFGLYRASRQQRRAANLVGL